ncbi:MAG: APH(3') family aminoglycoside O-phosphotransferase [Myxococcota bacterium]
MIAYAKQGRGRWAEELRAEIQCLRWLQGQVAVPELLGWSDDQRDGQWVWMVTSVLAGTVACGSLHRREPARTIVRVAEALRQFHALPRDECPFDARLGQVLAVARLRVARGWVDESDFDQERQGWTATEVLAEVERTVPVGEDLVVTHGDPCLPNVLFDGPRLGGWIDLGRLGVGDRHRDLALVARSADYNLGARWGQRLLEAYGGAIDEERLAFYRMLDELW